MHHYGNKSHGTVKQEFGTTQDYLYLHWLLFYLFYLFEILRCLFRWSFLNLRHFRLSPRLHLSLPQSTLSFSLSPSLPLTPHSVSSCLCLIWKNIDFVWSASLIELIWRNVAPHLAYNMLRFFFKPFVNSFSIESTSSKSILIKAFTPQGEKKLQNYVNVFFQNFD